MEPKTPVSDRAKEPSTWIGLIATAAGIFFGTQHPTTADPTFWAAVTAVVSGLVNIFTKEKSKS